ncbi:MAG: SH3 domain-containing protein [Leptospiraceae bacterium]|nr:SH3 domain-containing protein [Leptospiraceae bacterium]
MVLLILIQVTEACYLFKSEKPPEYYVIQRNQFRKKGFVYECKKHARIKFSNSKYKDLASDIELYCLEKNIVHSFHLKDFKKKVETSTDNDGTIYDKHQKDYDNDYINDNIYNFEPAKQDHWKYGAEILWDVIKKSYRISDLRCYGLYRNGVYNQEYLTMEFDKDGNVTKREYIEQELDLVPYLCAEIIPFISEGKYEVIFDELKVFEKPSKESKVFFTLDEKDKVDVIEDTHVFAEINHDVAPFVKIKTEKGKEGFVFGAGIAEIR